MKTTLSDLIAQHPDAAPALGAPGREWLSYAGLRQQAKTVQDALRSFGVSAKDRVAIVLPNGSDMASAFICVAQAATTAPLNPSYREDEFAFYLDDLSAKAIILPDTYDGPALAAAQKLGLMIIRLVAKSRAGEFSLHGPQANPASLGAPTQDDIALILHTSGTTSRPKIVPLLQSNVVASAQNIMKSLALTKDDCCLNVMPLFHIHGLIAAVSGSLAAGASISCAPGFDALKFYSWLEEVDPSWYTAVPTMHQAILARAPRNPEAVERLKLRLIRSSSSSLPPQVMVALEE